MRGEVQTTTQIPCLDVSRPFCLVCVDVTGRDRAGNERVEGHKDPRTHPSCSCPTMEVRPPPPRALRFVFEAVPRAAAL